MAGVLEGEGTEVPMVTEVLELMTSLHTSSAKDPSDPQVTLGHGGGSPQMNKIGVPLQGSRGGGVS